MGHATRTRQPWERSIAKVAYKGTADARAALLRQRRKGMRRALAGLTCVAFAGEETDAKPPSAPRMCACTETVGLQQAQSQFRNRLLIFAISTQQSRCTPGLSPSGHATAIAHSHSVSRRIPGSGWWRLCSPCLLPREVHNDSPVHFPFQALRCGVLSIKDWFSAGGRKGEHGGCGR